MGAKPDPTNFRIVRKELVGNNTIVLANYPGCKTFEGDKLMVLRGDYLSWNGETLDPHFLNEDYPVVARFIPTAEGWALAKICARSL